MLNRTISIAPMLDCTDKHYRYFMRLITRHALLYTEMIHMGAILHGDTDHHLLFDSCEHPLALQIGGSDPTQLAKAAKIVERYGYDEINLNVGCPSSRVQAGRFGACLMREPQLVAECVVAMRMAVDIPVTVKTRVGVDNDDSYEQLTHFVATVSESGVCQVFIIHARKAWLKGLSPKENRQVPPLQHDVVKRLKRDFPHLSFLINGGINTLEKIRACHAEFDGVMVGREAYANPYLFANIDADYYGDHHYVPSRQEVIENFLPYVKAQLKKGVRLSSITRHINGLFQGEAGAKNWRRNLSQQNYSSTADTILQQLPS